MKAQSEIRKGAYLAATGTADAQPDHRSSTTTRVRISEIYESVQGEGLLTGTPSLFVRTSGCNLRCWFCDTPFASWRPEGQFLSLAEIASRCEVLASKHVVLTGGEPMIYKLVPELCDILRGGPRHLTIETAGTIDRDVACDLMSISPKLSGSAPQDKQSSWYRTHHRRREQLVVVRELIARYVYQLKFVVDSPADAEEVLRYLDRLGKYSADRVLLMPQGVCSEDLARQAEWLKPWCHSHQFRYCPRSHIEWFGNARGT